MQRIKDLANKPLSDLLPLDSAERRTVSWLAPEGNRTPVVAGHHVRRLLACLHAQKNRAPRLGMPNLLKAGRGVGEGGPGLRRIRAHRPQKLPQKERIDLPDVMNARQTNDRLGKDRLLEREAKHGQKATENLSGNESVLQHGDAEDACSVLPLHRLGWEAFRCLIVLVSQSLGKKTP